MLSKSLTIGAAGNSLPPSPDPVWNLSTATFNGTPINYYNPVAGERSNCWNGTGTKWITLAGTTLYEYSASSAFDVSTLSYVQSLSISALETGPRKIFLRADGLKLYLVGDTANGILEFTFSVANNISTLSLTRTFSVATQTITPQGLFFKPDGTKMYVVGTESGARQIFEYVLSTAWNVSTASFRTSFNFNLALGQSLTLSSTGVYAYLMINTNLYQYTLSTAWDISTCSYTRLYNFTDYASLDTNHCFNDTGTKLYICGRSNTTMVWSFDLSIAWNLSTATWTPPSNSTRILQNTNGYLGMYIDPTGNHLYRITRFGSDTVFQYVFGTPFDLTTLSYVRSVSVGGQESEPFGVTFSPDGLKMYVVGYSGDDINEYTLGTAWNISTASFVQSKSVSAQFNFPFDVVFKPDGKKMYVGGWTADNIAEYSLSSAWNVSTATYVRTSNITFRPEWETILMSGFYFRSDGFYLYVTGASSTGTGLVYEYVLSTAWDISTLSLVQTKDVRGSNIPLMQSGQDTALAGISFNPDGSQMFLADTRQRFILSFDMTPPTP